MTAIILETVILLSGVSSPLEPPDSGFTAEALRNGIGKAQDRIQSLHVVYRSHGYDPKRYPKGSYHQRIVTVKAPCFFSLATSHGHDLLDWTDDPLQQRTYVTADRIVKEFPISRSYLEDSLGSDEPLPGTLSREFLFLPTGFWPYPNDNRRAPTAYRTSCARLQNVTITASGQCRKWSTDIGVMS